MVYKKNILFLPQTNLSYQGSTKLSAFKPMLTDILIVISLLKSQYKLNLTMIIN